MEVGRFFWDTYALVELLQGNPNYARFASEPVVLTIFNLVEVFWVALREYPEEKAEQIYEQYRASVVELDDETLKAAIRFRLKHKRQKLSYADCVGYVYALQNKMKFLTGDKQFDGLANVEFVK